MSKRQHENTLTGNPSLIDSGFDTPPVNPMDLFSSWIHQVKQIPVSEPNGFTLSTVDTEGAPSSRILLMKSFDDTGLVFCSSSLSQKGIEMSSNSQVAGTFWWKETMQQINFKGTVTQLSDEQSDELFKRRVRAAQAIAALSEQSCPLESEYELKQRVNKLVAESSLITRPKTWTGYYCKLTEIEFWVGSKDRFHKRLKYVWEKESWNSLRLQP